MQRRKLTDFRGIFRGFQGCFGGFQGNFEMIFRWFSHPDFRLSPDFRPHDFEAISDAEVTEVTEVTEVIKWQAIRPCYSFRAVILSREKKSWHRLDALLQNYCRAGCVNEDRWSWLKLARLAFGDFWRLFASGRTSFGWLCEGRARTCDSIKLIVIRLYVIFWDFFPRIS